MKDGVMNADDRLKQCVSTELAWDPAINEMAVDVSVKDGTVTLSGQVRSFDEKFAIERAMRRMVGVKALALELQVRLEPEFQRSDAEIAAAANPVLAWLSAHSLDKIRLSVEDGVLHLGGEVDWNCQRMAVEARLRALPGVVGINNGIAMKYRLTPAERAVQIERALMRQVATVALGACLVDDMRIGPERMRCMAVCGFC